MRYVTRIVFRSAALCALLVLPSCAAEPGAEESAGDADYAEAMNREHGDEEPTATPAAAAEPASAVATREVDYGEIDGRSVTGYLALPEDVENPPGILVIQEWWGLNENIRSMAERLAGEGYAALAVDLYRGQVATEPRQARQLMEEAMGRPEDLRSNIRSAYEYLITELGSPRVGVIGWCFGGGWALQTALRIPELDAAVVYYGRVETDPETLKTLEVPLLGHFGAADEGIPVASVRELESALQELDKDATIHVYEGAGHAFANPSGSRYQEDAAETAWERTREFLAEELQRE